MKLDSESMCGGGTLASKPDYKSFKFSGNSEEIRGFKADKRIHLKDENIVVCDSIDRRECMTEYTAPRSESEGSEERAYFYTDEKNVMDCELPELVTFSQESNCQVVKDIGIDRGVLSREKCLIENCELDHDIMSCFLNSDVDRTTELTKVTLDTVPSISNRSKSSIDLDCNEDVFKQCGSETLMKECEVDIDARDEILNDGSTKKTVNKNLLLAREVDTNLYHTHLTNPNGHSGEEKFDQAPCKEAVLANSMVFLATEVIDNVVSAIEAASKSEVQNGSIIHDAQNVNCKPPLEIDDKPRLEDDNQHGYAESSFSAAGPLLGPITCSGRSYSGSISLRSTSSTTSTQSFAFPILSTEWNGGSPVRMEKADPKNLQKHRRWWMCLPCCKF